jgi:flavin-dependent dehydrogenase
MRSRMRDLAPSPSPASTDLHCDVVVVGGGPAGSTAATLLARRGWSVALVEKHRHPRFHIGESLLPMNVPILERLGVLDAVAAIGVRKNGADFPAANERGYNVFRFDRQLDTVHPYAFQVQRAEFDELLFRHAASNGVRTFEDTEVSAVEFGDAGATCIANGASGPLRIEARYVVDASGRDTLLGNRLKMKRRHPRHQSAAMFAHFRGVERRPGDDAGNISIYRFEHGWVWLIPLRDGVTSIGAVGSPDWLKSRAGSRSEFLLDTLRSVPNLTRRLEHAELVGHMNATGNYSYSCERAAGPRWILVGDAHAFLDPIFSSGVYLAMRSAERAVDVVDGALRAPRSEARLQRAYAREAAVGLGTLGWYIERFTTPAMRWLFANPRNVLRSENAMVSMLAGDVFRGDVRRRLWIFRSIYAIATLVMWRESRAHWRRRRQIAQERFHGGTTAQDSA